MAACEALLGLDKGGENTEAAATLAVDLAQAFEKVQLIVVWQWANSPQRVLRVLCGYFAHERRLRYAKSFWALLSTPDQSRRSSCY